MAEKAPDYTVTNNPHALIHCGPIASDQAGDDERDLTIATSTNCQVVYSKTGNKVEHIQGWSGEVVGHEIDPTQTGAIGKAIVAKAGDIALIAESGNIRLKAKNIYIETSGEKGEGNFMVSANGGVRLSTGHEFRVAAGRMCFVSEGNMNFVGNMVLSGGFSKGSAVASAGFLSSLLAGNWASVVTSLSQTCK